MGYDLHDRTEAFLKKSDVRIEETTYAETVTVRCVIENSRLDDICAGLKELTAGRIRIDVGGRSS